MDSDFGGSVERLKTMLRSLRGVLDDAEQRKSRDNSVVESWLSDVQEAVFDADDFLDEIESEALRLKVEGNSGAAAGEVRRAKRPRILDVFSFFRNLKERDLEKRAKKTVDRLEEIVKRKEVLGLKETLAEEKRWRQIPYSTSLAEESEVLGRDAERESVIELLLSEDGSREISVIPIVGMGGVGKTTLAQTVFNDSRVLYHFDLMLWVCVSEIYDVHSITRSLLRSASSSPPHDTYDLNSLQIKLRDGLAGKKFLIVFDDVWTVKLRDWEVMTMPLKDGSQGSKIIVTSRNWDVARITGTVPAHHLSTLTGEASWELFAKHAFGNNVDTNPDLEWIGREIARKCKGLPLALKTLGGLLRCVSDVDHWERILVTELWELRDEHSSIMSTLRLSYQYLPSHLKRCFVFCAIFPSNYQFEKDELISHWMAQNLLEQPQGIKSLEDVGDQYFNDLISRSLIQPSAGSSTRFFMHDLILDLAIHFSGKYRCRQESWISNGTMRHLVCVDNQDNFWERINSNFRASQVRGFIVLCSRPLNVSHEVLCSFLSKMKYLRTLSFSSDSYNCGNLIVSICELRHLRFLRLSNIASFPDSLCTLYNLQTLKFAGCGSLRELPKDFHCLINLRYLDASFTGLESLPNSICRLSNLQKLIVNGCRKLTKLPCGFDQLTQLRYLDASSTGLESLPDSICKLSNLQELIIHGCWKLTKVPGNLHRITNLKYLDVSSTMIKYLPDALQRMSNLKICDAQSTV